MIQFINNYEIIDEQIGNKHYFEFIGGNPYNRFDYKQWDEDILKFVNKDLNDLINDNSLIEAIRFYTSVSKDMNKWIYTYGISKNMIHRNIYLKIQESLKSSVLLKPIIVYRLISKDNLEGILYNKMLFRGIVSTTTMMKSFEKSNGYYYGKGGEVVLLKIYLEKGFNALPIISSFATWEEECEMLLPYDPNINYRIEKSDKTYIKTYGHKETLEIYNVFIDD